jgi:hypothetical protein
MDNLMSEQEQNGAVQSAEDLLAEVWGIPIGDIGPVDQSSVDLVRERDAAIRRAAIEECALEVEGTALFRGTGYDRHWWEHARKAVSAALRALAT